VFSQVITFAQTEPQKLQEFSLDIQGRGLGTTYRWGQKESLWSVGIKFNTLFEDNEGFGNTDNKNLNIGIYLGREWRKSLTERLTFRYGLGVGYEYGDYRTDIINLPNPDLTAYEYSESSVLATGTLGIMYNISEKFFIGIEARPNLGFSFQRDNLSSNNKTTHIRSIPIGLNFGLKF